MSTLRTIRGPSHWQGGFTLIELMIAMLLGLIVIGGVTSVFLAGQQTYRANEALGDVGDSSRVAFEMLSRDIRGAGLTGCDSGSGRVANVLSNTTLWYTNWNQPLQGFDDASSDPALGALTSGVPVAGTSSVRMLSTTSTDAMVGSASGNPASFNINTASTQLAIGDIVMVCDFDHATITQITSYSGTSVGHASGATTVTPGNCTTGLGYPALCTSNGNAYTFMPNARVGLLTAADWYIGTNPVGGQSLYRRNVSYGAAGASVGSPQEMVRNVTNMQIRYLPAGSVFGNAASVTDWSKVSAAQITLTVQSANTRASVNNAAPLTRQFTSTITLRNRVQ
jgi:type IV pilus assembly protein PilW